MPFFPFILLPLKWKESKMVRPGVFIPNAPGDFMDTSPTKLQLWLMLKLSVFIRSVPSILELECVCVCVHLVVYIELPNHPFCLYTQVSLFLTRGSSSCVCIYTCTCVCTDVCMCFCIGVHAYMCWWSCSCVHMHVKALFLRQGFSLTWSLLKRQDWLASNWASKICLSSWVLGFAHRLHACKARSLSTKPHSQLYSFESQVFLELTFSNRSDTGPWKACESFYLYRFRSQPSLKKSRVRLLNMRKSVNKKKHVDLFWKGVLCGLAS